jgi:uncharacterized protein (DUF427 family)
LTAGWWSITFTISLTKSRKERMKVAYADRKDAGKHRRESVWDYPRPPRVESSDALICVEFGGEVIAESRCALRVLETSHPPVYYLPRSDVRLRALQPEAGATFCEYKGRAEYFSVQVKGKKVTRAAWHYPHPRPPYEELAGHVAFYVQAMDSCSVNGERVTAQPGSFYGGWITADIAGPFKGAAGTEGW